MIDHILQNQILEASNEEIKQTIGKIETPEFLDFTCIICHSLPVDPSQCK